MSDGGAEATTQETPKPSRRKRNWGIALGVLVVLLSLDWAAHAAGFIRPGNEMGGSTAMDMNTPKGASLGSAQYPYAVGDPGVGAQAPAIKLKSTAGGTFDLGAAESQGDVLIYFQEGLSCQPCWDQIVAIQQNQSAFEALGITTIVSVTTDPYGQLQQKASDEQLTIPVLADENGSVSDTYQALRYGRSDMGVTPGDTFILVGKDGKIKWRADYGGPPKHTMQLPVDQLLADLKAGVGRA